MVREAIYSLLLSTIVLHDHNYVYIEYNYMVSNMLVLALSTVQLDYTKLLHLRC